MAKRILVLVSELSVVSSILLLALAAHAYADIQDNQCDTYVKKTNGKPSGVIECSGACSQQGHQCKPRTHGAGDDLPSGTNCTEIPEDAASAKFCSCDSSSSPSVVGEWPLTQDECYTYVWQDTDQGAWDVVCCDDCTNTCDEEETSISPIGAAYNCDCD